MENRKVIRIPHEYEPREYQLPLLRFIESGGKRAFCVWHRRAGKDITLWNLTILEAFKTPGLYYYLFPTYSQGRKVIWDGVTNDGKKFVDYIPEEIKLNANQNEMKVLISTQDGNESLIQVIGTDKYDAIRGSNPRGCVFSEFAYQDPQAWEVVKPILRVNKGWAIFNTTPNGENKAYSMLTMAEKNKRWFTQVLTVDDTNVVSKDDIDQERIEGMSEDMIQQEYYCSFEAGVRGAYFARELERARKERRITKVPVDTNVPVHTSWDLGISDKTVIIFFQVIGKEIHIIDYYENDNEALAHYFQVIHEKGYWYGEHYFPHDVKARELGTGRSRFELANEALNGVSIAPNLKIEDGIEAAKSIFSRCWFDDKKADQLISALGNYRREWDDKRQDWKPRPLHDWSSHAADSFRMLAVSLKDKVYKNTSGIIRSSQAKLGANRKQVIANRYVR